MEQIPSASPEVGIIRTTSSGCVTVPWTKATDDNLDLEHAAKVLDKHHYGLPKVKERILEYMAVRQLAKEKHRSPILCFVGPPGVGKTSLGRSIAEALGRKFVRVSLGGIRDEAEIRGHRRTYVGALPGRIIHGMKQAGTVNPRVHARRDRQAGRGLPRRSVVGAAGGAGPGAEPRVLATTTSTSTTTCRR